LLTLDNTDVTDLGPLNGLSLTSLSLRGSKVENLRPLGRMPSLRFLTLQNTNVSAEEAKECWRVNPQLSIIGPKVQSA
jgi:Leucine-rich repeat (LRR) protein